MSDPSRPDRLDLVIVGARIVDGTGRPAYDGDVGVANERIAEVGRIDEARIGAATRVIDAAGLVLAPGFVDPHTHYDAQLFWDPYATPSSLHGVTSVVSGNCGFTLAPVGEADAGDVDYLCRMMANVEGMPLEALEQALPWDWRSFGDYLDRLDGRIAVNAGFLVGHCAIRRAVMGDAAVGERASGEQVEAMVTLLRASLAAGGLGFSTSRAFTHTDGEGEAVPSRWAAEDEVLALCREVGNHAGTSLEFIFDGCLNGFEPEEIELAAAMSRAADRPANWNVLTISASDEDSVRAQVAACEAARAKGGRIVALTMPVIVDLCMSFKNHCALHKLPGWAEVLSGPIEEQMARLRDPAVRERMQAGARSPEAGVLRGVAQWGRYKLGDGPNPALAPLRDRPISEIAKERGLSEFDTLVDLVLEDELGTILWPLPRADDEASWALRREIWDSPHVMLGGSDAGAHLDRMCGAPYPTMFLADALRGRRLVSLERAVAMMTSEPADLFGLRDRGRIAPGAFADLVLFDPETVDATSSKAAHDLPDGSVRLVADPIGLRQVIVNGQVTIENGKPTGACAGRLFRSGRDTDTVGLG